MKKWSVLIAVLLTVLCLSVCHAESGFDPAAVAVGDIVTFGHYEQDNDLDNGPEPIEWIVLDVQDGKALLLSKYGLEAIPYNVDYVDVTWETCTLRAWLNDNFLNKAFNAKEQAAIPTTKVDNSDAQGFDWPIKSASGGNNTEDKAFLLSYAEANRYLDVTRSDNENTKSRVTPTEYAIKTGAYVISAYTTADGAPAGWWWLRSPGPLQSNAAMVFYVGALNYNLVYDYIGVARPALWVDLKAGVF